MPSATDLYTTPLPPAPDAPPGGAMDALYRAALGPVNVERYLPLFARYDANGRASAGWNGAASLCTINWMVFRHLWTAVLIYVAAAQGVALLAFGIGRQWLQWPVGVETGVLGALAVFAFAVPGLFGDAVLHADIRKRIARALAASRTVPQACTLLGQQGSSRKRLQTLVLLNVVLALGAALLYLMLPRAPVHATQSEPALTVAQVASANATASPSPAAAQPPAEAGTTTTAPGQVPTASSPVVASPPDSQSAPATTPAPAPTTVDAPGAGDTSLAAANAPSARASAAAPQAGAVPAPTPESAPAAPPAPSVPPGQEVQSGRQAQPAPQAAAAGARPAPSSSASASASARATAASASPTTPAQRAVPPARTRPEPVARAPDATASDALPPPVGTARGYYINVGLFAEEPNARKAQARLLNEGFPAFRQELVGAKGRRIRVRVGPYDSRAEAGAAAASIRAMALEAVVFKQ